MKIIVVESMDEVLEHSLTRKLDWGVKHRKRIGGFFGDQAPKSAN